MCPLWERLAGRKGRGRGKGALSSSPSPLERPAHGTGALAGAPRKPAEWVCCFQPLKAVLVSLFVSPPVCALRHREWFVWGIK